MGKTFNSILYLFLPKIYPFSRVNNPKDSLSAAAGGFILCRANLFKNENLYDFIKNKVIDDCNLAKIIKKKGNIWLGLTEKVYSQRNYNKISQIWLMVSRTAYEQLNFSLITLICSAFAMVLIYLYPIFSIIYFLKIDNNFLFFVSLFSTILMTISIIPTILFYKLNFLYFFSLPLSSIIYIMMTITSALNFFTLKKVMYGKGENISDPNINEKKIKNLLSGKTFADENFPVASLLKRYSEVHSNFLLFARMADDIADHHKLSSSEKVKILLYFDNALKLKIKTDIKVLNNMVDLFQNCHLEKNIQKSSQSFFNGC